MERTKYNKISLPALRGKMGDWFYYISLLSFDEVAKRVKLPEEIKDDNIEEAKLKNWIQRKLQEGRTKEIVSYLQGQKQRFFNSLILGIYDGNPSWQELSLKTDSIYDSIDENSISYFERTFGILTLEGDERIFAIDGQHRAYSIRQAVEKTSKLKEEEISVIFVAHKTDDVGRIRTRRLFSTLNKYAKPVSQSEIIALSEDNNCSIITRRFYDENDFIGSKVQLNKTKVIRPNNKWAFTNIMTLYEIIEILLTNKRVAGQLVEGYNHNSYTTKRVSDEQLKKDYNKTKKYLIEFIESIPSLKEFFNNGSINREAHETNLIFRPIGQNVIFAVYKYAISHKKKKKAIEFFNLDNFNLKNPVWNKVFWDKKVENINTNKANQRYAILLILEHLGFVVKRTKKDSEIFESFNIDPNSL
jgi:DNA sulfur modification protein DndB